MIRMGIVGCGKMARSYMMRMRELSDRLVFTATVDTELARAREAAEPWPGARATTDYRQIMDDIDAVILALPHDLHFDVAMAFLNAGKHVLLEKPMANTEQECLELIKAQQRAGKVLMVGYVMRFDPLWVEMGRLIREKTYGETFQLSIWTEQLTKHPGAWAGDAMRLGGGQLFSHGCHYIDLMLHWMGNPESGTHVGTNFGTPWMDMEGTSNVSIKFRSGATGYHFGTWGARGSRLRYSAHAHCTEGMLELDHRRGVLILHRDPSGGDLPAGAKPSATENILMEVDRTGKNTYHEVGYFLDCIAQNREPITNARIATQSLRTIWRLYAAEHQGMVADLRGCGLDEFEAKPDPVLAAMRRPGLRVPALCETVG